MTKFYKLDTQEVLTFSEAKALFPRTGIPNDPTLPSVLELFAEHGIHPITPTVRPSDTATHTWDEAIVFNSETKLATQNWVQRPKTEAEIMEDQIAIKFQFESAIQEHLDAQARELRFDNIHTAVTYAEEPSVSRFQIEGAALRAWRSLVWAYTYQALEDVLSGVRPQPTIEQFIAELPAFINPYEEE